MQANDFTTYRAVIHGKRLMMHNEQLANPFNPYALEFAKVARKRGKTLEDHRAIAEIEFQGGLYLDPKEGPYIPGRCLNKMLVEGARRRKLGKLFQQMVIVDREVNPVKYDGPRTRKALWAAVDDQGQHQFADQRLIGINAARTLRTRPLFTDWTCQFVIKVVDGAVNAEDVRSALEAGGSIGILDGRPIYAGQFTTLAFDQADEARDVAP